jgi:uncharacterized protein YjbI with pentapeptide repeats
MSIFETRATRASLLAKDHSTEDTLFINERFDGEALGPDAPRYKHCTFANVSFKDAKLTDITFEDCVFIGCYFRRTTLSGCKFPASRFIDCDFSKPGIFNCSFAYARFTGTPVEHDYISASIGGEHNIRREISANLAHEAQAVGRTKDARQFRLDAIAAQESFLRAGYRHETDYYRRKFQGLDQFAAWLAHWRSRMNGLIWGYGERALPLVRNLVILTALVFPVLLLLSRDDLSRTNGNEVSVLDCWFLSVGNVLNNTSLSGVVIDGGWARVTSSIEAGVGLIALGLFITLLFRAVTRR